MKRRQKVIQFDPERAKVLRTAWDLLLTDRYTLQEICQELHDRGYTRKSGKPWVWEDPKTGRTCYAVQQLIQKFRHPFYAGWVVSKAFGYKRGDKRGNWPALVTDQELDEGIEILRRRDGRRDHFSKQAYLLASILHLRAENGQEYVMYGSTPRGRSKYYSYYKTRVRVDGRHIRFSREPIEELIPEWLAGLQVDSELMPAIRHTYETHAKQIKGPSVDERLADLKAMLVSIQAEEADYVRLLTRGKLSESNYDLLYEELQRRIARVRKDMHQLTSGTVALLDGLDQALYCISRIVELYDRLEPKAKRSLLRILFKRIIIDTEGRIVELLPNPPFAYLQRLSETSGSGGSQPGMSVSGSKRKITFSLKQ